MDINPYQSPESVTTQDSDDRQHDRDQCPACSFRQQIWKAINVVGRYRCPNCSAALIVCLHKRHRRFSLIVNLAIGLPALLILYFNGGSNVSFSITYSSCCGLLMVALGTFYFPWKFGYLAQK